jgi:peroxiredoxin
VQKTIDKYKNDGDVVFLFVDTWQQEIDKKKNAEDFIKDSKYTFHVLLDNDNKVVTSYKVSGIPTKFIIDKKGNIRFNVSGTSSGDVAVQELSTMINLAKE